MSDKELEFPDPFNMEILENDILDISFPDGNTSSNTMTLKFGPLEVEYRKRINGFAVVVDVTASVGAGCSTRLCMNVQLTDEMYNFFLAANEKHFEFQGKDIKEATEYMIQAWEAYAIPTPPDKEVDADITDLSKE